MHLYDKIPATLWHPLSGPNGRRTWDLLVRLVESYFGPEATPEYADGQLREDIVKAIERFLKDNAWENEDGGVLVSTPINIQANGILVRLIETGWFIEDKVGVRRFVNMRPVVSRFFETIQQFSEEGPQLIGGSIQMVYAQLKRVMENPKDQVPGFIQASKLVAQLIHGCNSTTLRVRDLMKDLSKEEHVPVFVERFFKEHISDMYIRDFRDLRTENHPLRLRYDILDLVDKVSNTEPSRTALLDGYRALNGAIAGDEYESLERDVRRFHKLMDIEKFLERMDNVIHIATKRAVAFIGYRLHSSDRTEVTIVDAIQSAVKADSLGLDITSKMLTTSAMMTEQRLRLPAPVMVKSVPTAMTKRIMTSHERAMLMLRKAMISHRDTSPMAMKKYVHEHLPLGEVVRCDQLSIESVEDATAFIGLMRLAAWSVKGDSVLKANPLLRKLGFEVKYIENERIDNEFFNAPAFTILRTGSLNAA